MIRDSDWLIEEEGIPKPRWWVRLVIAGLVLFAGLIVTDFEFPTLNRVIGVEEVHKDYIAYCTEPVQKERCAALMASEEYRDSQATRMLVGGLVNLGFLFLAVMVIFGLSNRDS